MAKNSSLLGTLLRMSLVGAAGVLAWRAAQRNRAGAPAPRDLHRWEGEGGSLPEATGNNATGVEGATARGGARGVNGASTNGAAGSPWPFPHS